MGEGIFKERIRLENQAYRLISDITCKKGQWVRRALWFSSKVTGKPFHPNPEFGSTAVTHLYPRAMGWGLRSERRKYVFPFLEI